MERLDQIQREVHAWAERNFENQNPSQRFNDSMDQFVGVVEELGELAHAILKARQGIRHSAEECDTKAKDAVGDILIFLIDFCDRNGWSMQQLLEDTWAQVRMREWAQKPSSGAVPHS